MKSLRFFYLPNERTEGDQIGPRKAFRVLSESGVFSAYQAYSYLVERQRASTQEEALRSLFAAAEAFQPDVIFWQHLNRHYPVDAAFFRRLKSIASRPKFVWHDPDPYGRFIKPIDHVMKAALSEADMAVVKGLGYFARGVRNAGAKRVLFSPESYDDERFGRPWEPPRTRPLDAVMIANLTCLKRIPWLHLPGGRSRKRLAQRFFDAYGERFAVYGSGQGWKGKPYCKGPIGFDAQESAVRSAWISINWSQFDEIPFYFSDRLPISLATGVPHITNFQTGFDHFFEKWPGIYFVRSVSEALDVADFLLGMPREQLIDVGQQARTCASERFNAVRVYGDMVGAIREQLFADAT